MGTLDYKQFSKRHRPHIQPPGANFFVTYRLAGSIAKPVIREYKANKQWLNDQVKRARREAASTDTRSVQEWLERVERFERDWFIKFEEILHKVASGPMFLKDERIAAAVCDSLHKGDGKEYRLDAFTVMSNHVHTVLEPFLNEQNLYEYVNSDAKFVYTSDFPGLSRILHRVKGSSARECNLLLSRSGQFWEHESFDHYIRQGKLMKTVRYVLNNPVKAKLVDDWREWRSSYCRSELVKKL